MIESLSFLREFTMGSVIVRLLFALAGGGLIGYSRSRRERSAGLRTYMLISIGAAMAGILGLYLYMGLKVPSDISRISAQVISGLGLSVRAPLLSQRRCPSKA